MANPTLKAPLLPYQINLLPNPEVSVPKRTVLPAGIFKNAFGVLVPMPIFPAFALLILLSVMSQGFAEAIAKLTQDSPSKYQ